MDETGPSSDRTRKLIRLKRYETPGESYFDEFLTEFQTRQRRELLELNSLSLIRDRLDAWLSASPTNRWAAAGVFAGGLLIAALLGAWAISGGESSPATIDLAQEDAGADPVEVSLIREF